MMTFRFLIFWKTQIFTKRLIMSEGTHGFQLVSSIFKEFWFLRNFDLDVPGGGRHPGTKQVLRLTPK